MKHLEFCNMEKAVYNPSPVGDVPHISVPEDSIESLIFAPDPETGVPSSGLPLLLNKGTRPEVEQYIRNVLMAPVPDVCRTDDPDLAIEMLKSRNESFEAYANRLRELCSKSE